MNCRCSTGRFALLLASRGPLTEGTEPTVHGKFTFYHWQAALSTELEQGGSPKTRSGRNEETGKQPSQGCCGHIGTHLAKGPMDPEMCMVWYRPLIPISDAARPLMTPAPLRGGLLLRMHIYITHPLIKQRSRTSTQRTCLEEADPGASAWNDEAQGCSGS